MLTRRQLIVRSLVGGGLSLPTFKLACANSPDARLTWMPGAQVNTTVVNVGNGYWRNDGRSGRHDPFTDSQDIVLRAPATRTGRLIVQGGRRIQDVGGVQILNSNDGSVASIYLDVAEEIYIESKHIILNHREAPCDGIHAGGTHRSEVSIWRRPTVILQNIRIDGVFGQYSGFHADGFQADYATSGIFIDRMTISTNYQGLFLREALLPGIPLTGNIEIRRCNIRRSSKIGDPPYKTKLLYFAKNLEELLHGNRRFFLNDVWIEVASHISPLSQVSPSYGAEIGRDEVSYFIWWPQHAGTISNLAGDGPGRVRIGLPPGGDFVTIANAGISFYANANRE